MGLQAGTNWRDIPLTCILLLNLASLVTGQLTWNDSLVDLQEINVFENTDVGTVIASMRLQSEQNGDNMAIKSQNSYVIVTETLRGKKYLEANITLNVPLDFESGTRRLSCTFIGSGDGFNDVRRVMLYVFNVDEPPTLQNKPYYLTVLENTPNGTIVYTNITAKDVDENDEVSYTLTPSPQTKDKDMFRINHKNGNLILAKTLNFEEVTFYQYTVAARDKSGHTDTADIFITIGDVQDTPPYFTGEPFQAKIWENLATDVLTIKAEDGDRGLTNEVLFKITNESCNGLFTINQISGLISSKTKVDREAPVFQNSGSCALEIMATEDNQHPQDPGSLNSATTSVIITILDINDNAPEFSQKSYNATVEENTQPGVMINFNTPISVTDRDQGSNALFNVKVIKLEDYFEVTPTKVQSTSEIWIRVKNSTILDYEKRHNLTIEIEANDTIHWSTVSVTIMISNINDNSPVFSNSTYYGSILENSSPSTSIIIIRATDMDENDDYHNYGSITYTIEGSDSGFNMDPKSGLITVGSKLLDREKKDTYSLTVFAEDGGHSKASVPVEIKILDENDETPKFVTSDYQTSLKEEGYTFIPPITVLAIDNDEKDSPNSEVLYSLVSTIPQGLESHFKMHSITGGLSVNSSLIYEDITFLPEYEGNITLIVEARDKGTPERYSSVSVVVILQDVNNNAPKCTQPLYIASVPENSNKSTPIRQVNATDNDGTAPNNMIMYSIDQDSAGKFIINSSTGLLSLRDTLDREEKSFYTIAITVTDNGATPMSGSCWVNVNVSDVNDLPPVFAPESLTRDFKENTMGLSVQTNATDLDLNSQLVYNIDWQNCNALGPLGQKTSASVLKNWIAIDKGTGEVKSLQPFDREIISEFVLQIIVEDVKAEEKHTQTDTATLTIRVLDVNDEAPVFSGTGHNFYNASIRENMPATTSDIKFHNQQTLEVSDADERGKNSYFEVALLTHNTIFGISPQSGTFKETFTISVLNSSALDYETTQSFTLEVLAKDPTNPSMSNLATILVNIINENDNIPEFNSGPYTAYVSENSTKGTYVTTVKAKDDDLDQYGLVFYDLPANPQEFTINNISGEVFTRKQLDREKQDTYTVSVRASDIGGFASTTQLVITVSDVNDNAPQFTGKQTSRNISENVLFFSQPFLIEATDDDAPGKNSKVVYSLLSTEPQSLIKNFTVNPDTGEITLKSPLDYESLNQNLNGVIVLHIGAEDQGSPPNSNITSVTIIVTDVNDINPHFNASIYSTDIPENFPLGPVFHATAFDGDASRIYSEVSYMIDTLSGSTFHINESSGEITLKKKLDYETVDNYKIIVTAMDHGNPVLTATTVVQVNVIDVNDQSPLFDQKQMQISVAEHKNVSYLCSANDKDLNKILEYSILWSMTSGQDGQGASVVSMSQLKKWITINKTTGEVKSLQTLDREKISEFVLQIIVEDVKAEENSPQNDTATLIIKVLDVNDEAPVFTATGHNFYNASIRENMPATSDIKFDNQRTLEVSDADERGKNSYFEVALLTHNTIFGISPQSGTSKETFTISVLNSSALDYETTQSFTVEVLAKDPTNPSMSSLATILVNIINENDNIPEFSGGPYKTYVPENSTNGTYITTVKATDKDLGSYGELEYSLDDSSKRFSIDNTTGEVVLLSHDLDRETTPDYTVTVIATDKGNFRATTQLTIIVTDVNDNPPMFSTEEYQLFIDEESRKITPTFYVQATDKDQQNTVNSEINYLLLNVTSSLMASYFSVNSTSGEFKLLHPLDYESLDPALNGTFTLTVVALDKRSPQNSANVSVKVVVKDVNDNPPKFAYYSPVFISENASPNQFVVAVSAQDKDVTPSNNKVSYSLDTFSANTFNIDETTGNITVKGKLDRELIPSYSVIVTAKDNGIPTQTCTVLINVNLIDVNDSPPTFSWDSKSVTVTENNNTIIAQNLAVDPDLDPDLYYSILWSESSGMDGNGRFISGDSLKLQNLVTINSSNGQVSPVNVLDREKLQRFQLTLVVEDKNNQPNYSNKDTAILTVVIDDQDDNSPTFNEDSFTAKIQENMPVGSEIKMINVSSLIITDADAGDNSMYNITLDNSSVFTISPSYGDGSTTCVIVVADTSLLDYEKRQTITIKVIATAHKTKLNSSATITVTIQNINDNFPIFNLSLSEVSVPENSHIGTPITILQAHDDDLEEFGIVYYFIDGTQTGFIINNKTGTLTLNISPLDRETKDSYTITVKARDTGGFDGSTQLTIRVTDVNDMIPKFQQLPYAVEVKENKKTLIIPLLVKAIDEDEPATNNSKISYTITHIPKELVPNPFKIDSASGEVTLSSDAPDYENLIQEFPNGTFQVEVTATDWGIPPLSSSAWISVTILDTNDNTPEFNQSSYLGTVEENSVEGVRVAMVSATDKDGTSPNNDIYYVIQSGSRDKLQINTTTGEISVGVGAQLDRETTEKYGFILTVLAIDKGSPPCTGTTTVTVEVLDVNDSPPKITPTSGVFTVTVYENASLGFGIAEFNATDEDENPNLTFSLLWLDSHAYDEKERGANASLIQEWLDIDTVTGNITVKSVMDRELVEQMILKVVVADTNSANGVQEATATVTVSLLDVNDNPPRITSSGSELHLSVSEGTKLGTEVTTLTATDADKGQIIQFSLPNTNSSFKITNQGKLTLIEQLDREKEPQLRFDVIATDSGSPPMSSNITVIIDVLDINDNDPYFPINQSTSFYVLENSNNTTCVATMSAKDLDAGDNGNVTFQFKDHYPFRIDPITGNVYVSEELDREKTASYTLTVIAADNPLLEASRRTLQPITIEVQDVNDNCPEFSRVEYQGLVPETASLGEVVSMTSGIISAIDKDEGNNGLITFSLLNSSNNYFSIDSTTGEVKVNYNITDMVESYRYVVIASDNGSPAKSTSINLTITVSDMNNHYPEFVHMDHLPVIKECAKGGVSVYRFSATDADKDKDTNGKVQYYFDTSTANNHSQFFTMNPNTGELYLKSSSNSQYPFANDELSELTISIKAVDCGVPEPKSQTATVKIKITDTNDNAPEFMTAPNTNFSVMEGVGNSKIGNVKAFDKDKDSILTYELSDIDDPWMDYFYIKSDPDEGGVIYVQKPLDREEVSHIKMKVLVSDKSSNVTDGQCDDQSPDSLGHSVTLDININVIDINDNSPVFQEKSIIVGFLSSTKYGEKIISLLSHVKDNDTAPNSVHKFYQVGEIQADSDIHKTWNKDIHPQPIIVDSNGTVSTNYKFIEDANGYFTIQVMANDSAGSDTASLKIYVVGESQVIHMTVWFTEDELRLFQDNIIHGLSDDDHKFVADNILPAYNNDGSVDHSKSVLVAHALDRNGNIVSGKDLVTDLDLSPKASYIRSQYKIFLTQAGDESGRAAGDESDDRNMFILIGVIAIIAVTFVITLYLLIQTIRRFKRKLKAATLEVHAMDPMKQDIFPGLDNGNIKSNNPIFMRDDLNLEESDFVYKYDNNYKDDNLSNSSENSLDQNAINSSNIREKVKSVVDEQEVTLDVYEKDETESGEPNLYQHLHFRHSQFLGYNEHSPNGENRQRLDDVDNDGNLDQTMNLRHFESTEI